MIAEERIRELELALRLALDVLSDFEPNDARAVSNEYVAMAAVLCSVPTNEALGIIERALQRRKLLDKD